MTRHLLLLPLLMLLLAQPGWALNDPTRPPDFNRALPAPAVEQRRYDLASIVIGPERRVAVINGVARREGERFDDARVRRIHPDRVEILDGGRVRILKLQELPRVRAAQ
ncbi:MAG: hypothetical protein R3280_13960 [Marinobacter sp.]|uniref:hypothetical protein n=1 Tax=Marinobacter sp. TaxID=50741 RepID=UPI00299F3E7C|nr:hypothetical protein [Marinobacter sp.]MDX1635742.1 hypothetical protein [Marinobacter sp.]